MSRTARTLSLMTLACLATAAHAGTSSLGLDSGLGLLSFSDLVVTGSSVNGSVAVGGNATVSNYSINPAAGSNGLVVAGNLDFKSGSIGGGTRVGGNATTSYSGSFGGSVAVGGALNAGAGLSVGGGNTTTVWGAVNGVQPWYPTVTAGAGSFSLGFDFAAEQARLGSLSLQLDQQATTGTPLEQWGTLIFDASNLTTAVFDISAADASKNMQINGLAAGASVIINVLGSSVDFGNHGYTNFGSGQVLFNLPEATSITFNGGTTASFLAPLATVQSGWGSIAGQVVVDSWLSSVSINATAFNGTLPIATAVPEPQSWALMLGGLFAIAAFKRRQRA
jgi:choice-of-anchor A domain-containing protein